MSNQGAVNTLIVCEVYPNAEREGCSRDRWGKVHASTTNNQLRIKKGLGPQNRKLLRKDAFGFGWPEPASPQCLNYLFLFLWRFFLNLFLRLCVAIL
ncbi:MAG: hypothetical protein BGO54_19430 [Sphingobacteriales bacterium 46-32]|nr:MAG: hypothetical protein BGO54_19430 [Sphingobacteriales bacterium 46-32]